MSHGPYDAGMTEDVLGTRGTERDTLVGFLDWYRAVVERKVQGLSLEDASRVFTPSGLSPLGVVKHLGYVERSWFRWRFAGEELEVPWTEDDPDADFRIETDDTVASVLGFYRTEVERARQAVATASLEDLSAGESPVYGKVSLRWILVHMLEETARHAGHLDLMREQLDGATGD
jgi:uncharacterized damage-inducible protein DinB